MLTEALRLRLVVAVAVVAVGDDGELGHEVGVLLGSLDALGEVLDLALLDLERRPLVVGEVATLTLRLADDVLGGLDGGSPQSLEVHPQTPSCPAYAVA